MGKRTRKVHKGGRPRKERLAIDTGTPELAAKRAALAREPTLSTCPLDIALSRGLIDMEAHSAANYFAACRALVFGNPHPRALDLLRVSGAVTILEASDAEARYRAACASVRARGPGRLSRVEAFVVHERFPRWLLLAADAADRDVLLDGLAGLLSWYRGRDRRRAA